MRYINVYAVLGWLVLIAGAIKHYLETGKVNGFIYIGIAWVIVGFVIMFLRFLDSPYHDEHEHDE